MRGGPSFKKIASAFGFEYDFASNIVELETIIQGSIDVKQKPRIIEVLGREDQKYVETAAAKTSSGKYARRPLEDQFPFMDREVFLKEMIVDPIKQ